MGYYKKYKAEGLIEPTEVKNATNEYKKDSDVYAQFRDDDLIRDEYNILKVDEAYAQFKVWFSQNITSKAPNRREFKQNIERKLGVKYGRGAKIGWSGWKLNCIDQEALAAEMQRCKDEGDVDDDSEIQNETATPAQTNTSQTKQTIIKHTKSSGSGSVPMIQVSNKVKPMISLSGKGKK